MLKKFCLVIITSLILTTIIPLCGIFNNVSASEHYPMSCPAFEVSYIEDDGSLTFVSCHDTYSNARKEMITNKDYVIRHVSSMSDTKIIGMNSGVAYSYPGRLKNSAVIDLYQNYKDFGSRYKQTYVESHYEMTYYNTSSYASDGSGYIRVNLNGFEGYANIQEVDLVPTKYLENNIPIWLGGNNSYTKEKVFLVKLTQNYYSLEKNGNYTDLVFHYFRGYGSNGGNCLSYSLHCDNAANYTFMEVGKKYYSNDGINFYSDNLLTNYVGTCYNYYQFLPVRSKTNIPASTFDVFLNNVKPTQNSVLRNMGSTYVKHQNTYGVNALMIYAMSCQEAAYGTSNYAVNENNLFGWSVYDDNTSAGSSFASVSACVKEMMGRNLRWFMDYTNKRYFGTCVGNKGAGFNVHYASDPYWGIKISAIAYSIDKFDNNNNGNLTDHNYYTVGFVKNNYNDVLYDSNIEWDPIIYKNPYSNDELYTGRYGSHYQKDLTVLIYEEVNGRYKIASTNNVINGEIVTDDGIFAYDWDESVGYIDKHNVIVLNGKTVTGSEQSESTYDPIVSVREVLVNDDKLVISGVAGIQGMNFSSTNNIKHEVIFTSLLNPETEYVIKAETISTDGFDLEDGWDYSYAGFKLDLNLPNEQLPCGNYSLKIRITNRDKVVENILYSLNSDHKLSVSKNDEQLYRLTVNEQMKYRFEMDIIKTNNDVDFTHISKPSSRPSLISTDSVLVDGNSLEINGHGFIHYLNYSNNDDVSYEVYLIDDQANSTQLDTSIVESDMDYKDLFSYNYDLTNICFKAVYQDLSELSGNYTVYVKITNGLYTDILEMPLTIEQTQFICEEKTVSINASNIRNRMNIVIE